MPWLTLVAVVTGSSGMQLCWLFYNPPAELCSWLLSLWLKRFSGGQPQRQGVVSALSQDSLSPVLLHHCSFLR